MSHVYVVSLRFAGPTLDSAAISARLGLPDTRRKRSAALPRRSRLQTWSYDGRDRPGFRGEWPSLEQGLSFLMSAVADRKAEIVALASEYDACWFCGHFSSNWNGGPDLSAALLTELASFGAALYLDTYFSKEWEGEPRDSET